MPSKKRPPIPESIKSELSYASNNICCLCMCPNRPMQIHHIDENPSHNEFDNLALLCLDCHNKTQITGGFAKKISASDIKKFRNAWYERVIGIRNTVDAIEIDRMSGRKVESCRVYEFGDGDIFECENKLLVALVLSIESRYEAIHRQAQFLFDVGDTYNIRNGISIEVEGLSRIINELKAYYPDGHFEEDGNQQSGIDHSMWEYAYKVSSPYGLAEAGTIIHAEAGVIFMNFLKFQINAIVNALLPEQGLVRTEWEKMKFKFI